MILPSSATHVAAVGLGASGLAAARLARLRGMVVTGFDDGEAASLAQAEEVLGEIGADCFLGENAAPAASGEAGRACDLVVLSPGVPPHSASLLALREAGVPVVGEIEFAQAFCDAPIIGITGTNGKTTTTALIVAMLEAGGLTTEPAGNYGTPFSDVVLRDACGDAITLELSSFQLEEIVDLRPRIAIWLNFAPDHLDRYSSLEEYRAAKLRIFENMGEGDTAIVRAGEDLEVPLPDTLTFSTEPEVSADLRLDGEMITLHGESLLDLSTTRLRGVHNAENAMAAAATAKLMGVSLEDIAAAARDFVTPRHRYELVSMIDGLEFINDSKATNLHALESALRGHTGKLVLIVGGKEKGLDYSPLAKILPNAARALVTIGEIGEDLIGQFGDLLPAEFAPDLTAAVAAAMRLAESGDTILFSPGTSSFDMFSGYVERGNAFCETVKRLQS